MHYNDTPILTKPDTNGNPYFMTFTDGGKNHCIRAPADAKQYMQNCVFFAVGAFAQHYDIWLPSMNAGKYGDYCKKAGYIVSNTPIIGALAVYTNTGAGHVATVENIEPDGVTIAQSGYSNYTSEFWVTKTKNGALKHYDFYGYIIPRGVIVKRGYTGDVVKTMQTALYKRGYLRKTEIDSDYGKITAGALLAFQFDNKLEIDGVCGIKTWYALQGGV